MNCGPAGALLRQFNGNWTSRAGGLGVEINGDDVSFDSDHALATEITALAEGRPGSLPFVHNNEVYWCTVARDPIELRAHVALLRAWVLPSFGGEAPGFVPSSQRTGALAQAILNWSPHGYFRWKCKQRDFDQVLHKLGAMRKLERVRPPRERRVRPSLLQLRAEFSSALVVGDRAAAERALDRIEELQLDTAVNGLFLRITLWASFREFERIRTHPDLARLRSQALPPLVAAAIDEALGLLAPSPATVPSVPPASVAPGPPMVVAPATPLPLASWSAWADALRSGDAAAADSILQGRVALNPADLRLPDLAALSDLVDNLFLDETTRVRERDQIGLGVAELLREFVREPDFPRPAFARLYAAVLRLWTALYAGTTSAREHGHVLLELASALLGLNYERGEAVRSLEEWWKARPSRAQLTFLLDALELLERELPTAQQVANLWIEAADLIRRTPDALLASERGMWRSIGRRVGFNAREIAEYLPEEATITEADPLEAVAGLRVAIVCMRSRQAREAGEELERRCSARVTLVEGKIVGADVAAAVDCDVVLFVWMATTHAVFRAFDHVDRRRLCYVQGTGASSIVRALERWAQLHGTTFSVPR